MAMQVISKRTIERETSFLEINALSSHIGVDVLNVNLSQAIDDKWVLYQLREALSDHLVLRIRGQNLTAKQLVTLSSKFGPLMDVRQVGNGALHVQEEQYIKVISNAQQDGRRLGDGNSAEQIWHVDASYWEAPPGVTTFYCRQAPNPAPKTQFLNMIKVYEALPEELKDKLAWLRVQHHQYPRGVEKQVAETGPSLPLEKRQIGATHPFVRRHLSSGRPLLFLPFRRDCLIPGMSDAEARQLIDTLWDFAASTHYEAAVGLEPDDVVIWDNSAIAHSREAWAPSDVRIMWHVSAQGEVPTPMFPPAVINTNALGYDGQGDKDYVQNT